MATKKKGPEVTDIHFPAAGVDTSMPFAKQPARPVEGGEYARTCRRGKNVRAYDVLDRQRGGARPGLKRYFPAAIVAGWIIQDVTAFVTVEDTVQFSNSGRLVSLVAVSQGDIYSAVAGDTAWTPASNQTARTPPLNFTGPMMSAANLQKLWFADGFHWTYFDPHTNEVKNWTASAGQLPVDEDGNKPRLIATWRGRTCLSGLLRDPHAWFFSAVDDPTDFDYSPRSRTPTQAVAGHSAPQGLIGDVVTAMVPCTDDVLGMGGDHSFYVIKGDPMAGGEIHVVSDNVGFAWGQAWCMDPQGNVFFVSNKLGVYAWQAGAPLSRISMAIEQELGQIDTGANTIRLLWDDRRQGLHVFVTPTEEPAEATHFFFEQRSGAWWMDTFANPDHNPITCCIFDGNEPGDRVALIGSWDGYVRSVDPDAEEDDGYPIESEVVIGPLAAKTLDELMMREIQAVLGTDSGDVTYAIHTGRTAEEALSNTAKVTGTFRAGRGHTRGIYRAGFAIYLRLTSTKRWAMETIRALVEPKGKIRMRGR